MRRKKIFSIHFYRVYTSAIKFAACNNQLGESSQHLEKKRYAPVRHDLCLYIMNEERLRETPQLHRNRRQIKIVYQKRKKRKMFNKMNQSNVRQKKKKMVEERKTNKNLIKNVKQKHLKAPKR